MILPTNKNKSRGKASNQAFTESTRLSSHHWCSLSHAKTRNSDTGHKHSQHSFFFSLLILCWFELRGKIRQVTGLSVEIHRHRSHTGQRFLERASQPSPSATNPLREPGSHATWRELRTSTNFVSGQGRHRASGLRGAGGSKSSAKCQRILQHLCRRQRLERHRAADAGHRSPGKQRHGCRAPHRPSMPPRQLPRPGQHGASRQPHG